MDGGDWQSTVHGVTKLSDFTFFLSYIKIKLFLK